MAGAIPAYGAGAGWGLYAVHRRRDICLNRDLLDFRDSGIFTKAAASAIPALRQR